MTSNEQSSGFTGTHLAAPQLGILGRLLTMAAAAALLVAVFMFSLLALGVLLVVGLLGFAYLKWKTRHLSSFLRQGMPRQPNPHDRQASPGGYVIEGEVIGDAEYETHRSSSATGKPTTDAPTRQQRMTTTDSDC